ncbi:zinc transporter ZntB [Gammaproteobacteria bacterium]|nr:zinc transporter ZntB [Gammaproteobacteria bacterium]
MHLDINEASSKKWADAELTFLDPLTLDALFAEETRPRILEFDTGTLLILRGVNLNADAEPEDMVSIRLWIDSSKIISVRKRRLKAVTDLRERIEAGVGPHNAGDFITQLTSRLFERMEPVFTELDELLDDAEERVMEAADTKYRSQITDIRKQAIVFRRYIAPQRDVIAALRVSDMPWLSELHKRRLQESLDRVIRYIEDIDSIRERAQIVKDELTNALSDKMNKNLYLLSVIAAVFLPLGFLTGLLGINVGGVPGVDDPSAFWVFSGFLSVVVALQILLFKRWKWF